jgi:hypothetical protein
MSVTWRGDAAYIGERRLGWITPGNPKEFTTVRVREAHFFRNKRGWGMATELLRGLVDRGVEVVKVTVKYEGDIYANVGEWIGSGYPIKYPGYEAQLILCEDRFQRGKIA